MKSLVLMSMVWIPAAEFTMGTDDPQSYACERPAHRVKTGGFFMDEHLVTNEEFKKFVDATGYLTTAEKKLDWELLKKQLPAGTPKPADSQLVPGSLVFSPPNDPVSLNNINLWWKWVKGANWKQPEGPNSKMNSLTHKKMHPVVHVSWDDAKAYCEWNGGTLPTEAQWEIAARGGLSQKRYPWGDELRVKGRWMANTFQGLFPHYDTQEDGFAGTSPVKSFPPNGYGLYDMIGNVWEWCSDWYSINLHSDYKNKGIVENPLGPDRAFDPDYPLEPKRVTKGGSFLCNDQYCINYRTSARRGTAQDTGASHIGFRCAHTVGTEKIYANNRINASIKR